MSGTQNRRTRAFRLVTVALAATLALVFGELIVRAVDPPDDTKTVRVANRDRLYGYPPNSSGFAGGVRFQTNSLGFRGRDDRFLDARTEDLVVVVLGDSYAFGYGVRLPEAFPTKLQTALSARHPSLDVHVVNLGVPGYNTRQQLATLQEFGPELRPDVVVLAYLLNDIEEYDEDGNPQLKGWGPLAPVYGLKKHIRLFRFGLPILARAARALDLDVQTTAEAEVREYLENGPAWQENQQVLRELVEASHGLGARFGAVVQPYIHDLSDEHSGLEAYEVATEYFRSLEVPAVNAFEYFTGMDAPSLWINRFDGHPNGLGHTQLTEAMLDMMAELPRLEAAGTRRPPREAR